MCKNNEVKDMSVIHVEVDANDMDNFGKKVSDAVNEKLKSCCGGSCGLPKEESGESLVVAPEGLDVTTNDNADLNKKIQDLLAKRKVVESTPEEVNTDDYHGILLPNGLRVISPKKSHKTAEDLERMIADAGGEMDCSDEDENGNPNPLATNYTDDGPAKSDYKPGQLKGLKEKYYPKDNVGAKAQARLDEVVMRLSEETDYRKLADIGVDRPGIDQLEQINYKIDRLPRSKALRPEAKIHRLEEGQKATPPKKPSFVRKTIRKIRKIWSDLLDWWRL